MKQIVIDNCVYNIHPIFDMYAASKDAQLIHIVKQVPIKGNKNHNGYMQCMVRKHAQKSQKTYFVHRFVWECFNGLIPEDKVIDHINNNKEDNRLCNLQIMTQQQNNKKSAKDRDYKFVANNHQNKKCVKALNQNTKEVSYYNSLYAVQQHLDINAGIVKMAAEGINKCKSGISKKDGCKYVFEYVKKEDMPEDYKKSSKLGQNRQILLSDEEKRKHQNEAMKKWQQKEYTCLKCNKMMKNNSKFIHNKKCK